MRFYGIFLLLAITTATTHIMGACGSTESSAGAYDLTEIVTPFKPLVSSLILKKIKELNLVEKHNTSHGVPPNIGNLVESVIPLLSDTSKRDYSDDGAEGAVLWIVRCHERQRGMLLEVRASQALSILKALASVIQKAQPYTTRSKNARELIAIANGITQGLFLLIDSSQDTLFSITLSGVDGSFVSAKKYTDLDPIVLCKEKKDASDYTIADYIVLKGI